jgi:hypothetical protein
MSIKYGELGESAKRLLTQMYVQCISDETLFKDLKSKEDPLVKTLVVNDPKMMINVRLRRGGYKWFSEVCYIKL